MKVQKILASGLALPFTHESENVTRSFFTFGDSYTTTSFNISDLQPSIENPMGNPHLGKGTTADGVNWVGYFTTAYNKTVVLNYNLAVDGATVNNSIIANKPGDLVYQVLEEFMPYYCHGYTSATRAGLNLNWTGEASLFAIWIGINDIHYSYLNPDSYRDIALVMQSYSYLLNKLYKCGARHFLLINVPPISRTPYFQLLDPWQRDAHQEVVDRFNNQLEVLARDWQADHFHSSMKLYDAWSFMNKVLDQPGIHGFIDDRCSGEGCIWWDDYHPTSAFHRLLATDIQRNIN